MKNKDIAFLARAAMIAAIYVVLTMVFAPFSFGEVQVRLAEALTILPLFTPAAIPGIFVGCLLGNLLGGAILPDIIFGSLTSLCAAILTYYIGKKELSTLFGTFPPIILNTIIVPIILYYGYGLGHNIPFAIPTFMLSVGIGEVISCGFLGILLYHALKNHRQALF